MNGEAPNGVATVVDRRAGASEARSLEPAVCVVIHDVADATLASCERLLAAIADVAPLPLTLLAVPRYHHDTASPSLEHWLGARSRGGDEIALHGWTHLDDGAPHGWIDRLRRRSYTRGEGEFWALPADEAALRLQAGIDWFERNGWPLHGFVAPAWLLGPGAWQALHASTLRYTSTLRHVYLLPQGQRITSQSLVYSTSNAWRRTASVAWAGIVAATLRSNPLLRIELHPRDADHAAVRWSWQHRLERALTGRTAMTVSQLTEHWRGTHAAPAMNDRTAEELKAD